MSNNKNIPQLEKNILVIENEYSNYYLIEELFSFCDLKITRAKNHAEVLNLITSEIQIHLVIMDIIHDGFLIGQVINKYRPELRIIITTGVIFYGKNPETKPEFIYDEIIYKPYDPNNFCEKVLLYLSLDNQPVVNSSISHMQDTYL